MSKKIILSITLCLAVNASVITQVFAEEMVISGNGEGSSNEVSISSTQSTNVQQTNEANVQNNVENDINTGNNETNNNTGDASIQTGDANSSVIVNNELNANFAENECCPTPENSYAIEGNGEGSSNSIYSQTGTNINSNQVNNATITNNITVKANTGRNGASNNNGDVFIKTGNITSYITVNNTDINKSLTNLAVASPAVSILISGNGANSQNNISLAIAKNITANITNNAFIFNNIFSHLNTGENKANKNNGNVLIETGDILSVIDVNNHANESFVHVDCDCEIPNGESPDPTPTIPPSPTQKPGDGKKDNPSNGSVAGASSNSSNGHTLPATGSYFLFLITIANLIAFFLGWYLRFRSGAAPNKVI